MLPLVLLLASLLAADDRRRAAARVPRRLGRHRRQHRLAVASPASRRASSRRSCSRSSTRCRALQAERGRSSRSGRWPTRCTRRSCEPWSEYLTGDAGPAARSRSTTRSRSRSSEAHARGLELHAWFNPYRAHARRRAAGRAAPTHLAQRAPGPREAPTASYHWLTPTQPDGAGPLARA